MITDALLEAVLEIWAVRREKTTCTIAGNSMAPLIRDGDSLVVEHGNQGIRRGDVVLFKTPEKLYAHRVVRVKRRKGTTSFLVKGDSSAAFDGLITREHILGKVVAVTGSNGHLDFTSPFWRFANVVVSFLSYVSGKHLEAESAFWKGLHYLLCLRSLVFPNSPALRHSVVQALCRVYNSRRQDRKEA